MVANNKAWYKPLDWEWFHDCNSQLAIIVLCLGRSTIDGRIICFLLNLCNSSSLIFWKGNGCMYKFDKLGHNVHDLLCLIKKVQIIMCYSVSLVRKLFVKNNEGSNTKTF